MNVVHNDFLDFFSPGESKHPVFGKCADKASFDVMVKISQVRACARVHVPTCVCVCAYAHVHAHVVHDRWPISPRYVACPFCPGLCVPCHRSGGGVAAVGCGLWAAIWTTAGSRGCACIPTCIHAYVCGSRDRRRIELTRARRVACAFGRSRRTTIAPRHPSR